MNNPPSEIIPLFNSSAYVSYVNEPKIDKAFNPDRGYAETAFVDNDSQIMIVLNGDHREGVRKIVESFNFPYLALKDWFTSMEKEWGSSWNEKSSIENWMLERETS